MKVLLATPRGFCAGVERAIAIVDRALHKHGSPVYVRHEIVHNRHVVRQLEAKGARFVEELQDVPPRSVTIFSAHGVSRRVEQEAAARRLKVLDATCPLVAKVHQHGQRYVAQGRTLVLIGHRGHPEVQATLGQIPAPVALVENEADVAALRIPAEAAVAYVTQTTLSVDDTRHIIAALHRRFRDLVGPDIRDICYATQNRQASVRELARHADVILVVGASNSSNANRLREIATAAGVQSHLIADAGELQALWVRSARTVGITAGASAPEVLVQDVVAALRRLGPVELSVLPGPQESVAFRMPPALSGTQGDAGRLQECDQLGAAPAEDD